MSYMKIRIIACFLIGVLSLGEKVLAQAPSNVDPTKGNVNINLPRTPESAGFEKYGNIPVSELTGAANVSIPVYTMESHGTQVPISLGYDGTGIKVNQEAAWVGLGWNLNVGGRITVEVKGCIDFDNMSNNLYSNALIGTGMQEIFTRLGTSNSSSVLAFAEASPSPYVSYPNAPQPAQDDWNSTRAMAQFGLGEPDIFHANFMGNSIDFFYDKVSGDMKFLGEKSLFTIAMNRDNFGRITDWHLTDNNGTSYYFTQQETTTQTLPPMGAVFANTATTAWLLTSIVPLNGDQVTFTYANYGNTYPASTPSASFTIANPSGSVTESNDAETFQNVTIQQPAYLTKVESSDVLIDFLLDTRTDLKGAGARKLNEIRVTDKLSNTVKKKVMFGYEYFNGGLLACHISLPQEEKQYYSQRLKLRTLTFNDSLLQPPYRFFYDEYAPDKYSSGQDHWGYNTGAGATTFGPCSPKNLIPKKNSEGNDLPWAGLNMLTATRDCIPYAMTAMTMDSIVYPTGGSTKFIYEPHISSKTYPFMSLTSPTPLSQSDPVPQVTLQYNLGQITGGGLRVKELRNYSLGKLAGISKYSYQTGIYYGAIRYNQSQFYLQSNGCGNGTSTATFWDRLTPFGAVNDNDFLVGYPIVTETHSDANGRQNGHIVKMFNLATPWYATNNNGGLGFDVRMPQWPQDGPITSPNGSQSYHTNSLLGLAPPYTGFAPTPAKGLSGKLMEEDYYNDANSMVKKVNYYYSLADYSQKYYSIKVLDNRDAGCDGTGSSTTSFNNMGTAFTLFASPAKSYFSLTDSVVETNYAGSTALTTRKSYQYDSHYQLQSEATLNSEQLPIVTNYKHPYDFPSTPVLQTMTQKHVLTPVVESSTAKNGTQLSLIRNNYFNPSGYLYVPQNVQVQTGSNPIETRRTFNAFDSYGNLLEQQKTNDIKETYLWGYHSQYPVAKIIGSDYAAISALINQATLDAPVSDLQLRTYLQTNLRQQLPNAQVTTYTYAPLIGLTSETDPQGRTSYYEYDASGRLMYIRDLDNNIVKAFSYKYKETLAFPYTNTEQSASFSKTCPLPGWEAHLTYVVPANTYGSYTSVADANSLAVAEVNAQGPVLVNNVDCIPVYSFVPCCNWNSVNNHFELTGTGSVSFSLALNIASGNVYGKIGTITGVAFLPSAQRVVNVSGPSGWSGTITVYPNGDIYIAGPNTTGVFQLSGTYVL
jgi:YD repeat-containing protein